MADLSKVQIIEKCQQASTDELLALLSQKELDADVLLAIIARDDANGQEGDYRVYKAVAEHTKANEEILRHLIEYGDEATKFSSIRKLYLIGIDLEEKNKYREAEQCYLVSAQHSYERSQFRLGMLYLEGRDGVLQDKVKAFKYMKLAAEQNGHDQSKACFKAAVMLEKGDGIGQDLDQAFKYYDMAASMGNEEARIRREILRPQVEAGGLWAKRDIPMTTDSSVLRPTTVETSERDRAQATSSIPPTPEKALRQKREDVLKKRAIAGFGRYFTSLLNPVAREKLKDKHSFSFDAFTENASLEAKVQFFTDALEKELSSPPAAVGALLKEPTDKQFNGAFTKVRVLAVQIYYATDGDEATRLAAVTAWLGRNFMTLDDANLGQYYQTQQDILQHQVRLGPPPLPSKEAMVASSAAAVAAGATTVPSTSAAAELNGLWSEAEAGADGSEEEDGDDKHQDPPDEKDGSFVATLRAQGIDTPKATKSGQSYFTQFMAELKEEAKKRIGLWGSWKLEESKSDKNSFNVLKGNDKVTVKCSEGGISFSSGSPCPEDSKNKILKLLIKAADLMKHATPPQTPEVNISKGSVKDVIEVYEACTDQGIHVQLSDDILEKVFKASKVGVNVKAATQFMQKYPDLFKDLVAKEEAKAKAAPAGTPPSGAPSSSTSITSPQAASPSQSGTAVPPVTGAAAVSTASTLSSPIAAPTAVASVPPSQPAAAAAATSTIAERVVTTREVSGTSAKTEETDQRSLADRMKLVTGALQQQGSGGSDKSSRMVTPQADAAAATAVTAASAAAAAAGAPKSAVTGITTLTDTDISGAMQVLNTRVPELQSNLLSLSTEPKDVLEAIKIAVTYAGTLPHEKAEDREKITHANNTLMQYLKQPKRIQHTMQP